MRSKLDQPETQRKNSRSKEVEEDIHVEPKASKPKRSECHSSASPFLLSKADRTHLFQASNPMQQPQKGIKR